MDFPDPEMEMGSPTLQVDSLPTKLSGKLIVISKILCTSVVLVLISPFSFLIDLGPLPFFLNESS